MAEVAHIHQVATEALMEDLVSVLEMNLNDLMVIHRMAMQEVVGAILAAETHIYQKIVVQAEGVPSSVAIKVVFPF